MTALLAIAPVAAAQTTTDPSVTTSSTGPTEDHNDFPYGLLGLIGLAGLLGLRRNDHDRVKTRA